MGGAGDMSSLTKSKPASAYQSLTPGGPRGHTNITWEALMGALQTFPVDDRDASEAATLLRILNRIHLAGKAQSHAEDAKQDAQIKY